MFFQNNRSHIQLIYPQSSISRLTNILQMHHRKYEDQVPNLGTDTERIHHLEQFTLQKPHCDHGRERQSTFPLHDHCTLKKIKVKNYYSTTHITFVVFLRSTNYFTKIDLKFGYHQALVDLQMFGKIHSRQTMVYMNRWKQHSSWVTSMTIFNKIWDENLQHIVQIS